MGLPSAVFILTGFLRTLPGELEQAARIDGAGEARIMLSIMLPLARPAMVIAGIQNAVPIWNDFFFPLVFVTSDDLKTLPQGLTSDQLSLSALHDRIRTMLARDQRADHDEAAVLAIVGRQIGTATTQGKAERSSGDYHNFWEYRFFAWFRQPRNVIFAHLSGMNSPCF